MVVKPSLVIESMNEWVTQESASPAPEADREQQEGDGGAGRGDLELLAGRRGLAAHLREAAEEPEVDAGDPDAEPARHERVPELVEDQRDEVAEGRGDGDQVVRRLRAAMIFGKYSCPSQ